MKKVLYGTTALVAAGAMGAGSAAADGIELGLGGYMNTYFSAGGISEADNGNNDPDYNPTGLFSDGEVFFLGRYKHDNGIVFGVNVQLEMFGDANSGGDTIDEKYMFVDGDFGRIVAGSENSAAYIMHYAAPFVGLPINSGWVTVFIPPAPGSSAQFRSPAVSTYGDFGNDENVLTYYTPRIAGFQLGVTYAPSVVNNGDGKNFPVEANFDTEYANGVGVGLNFVEDFNGFGVAISGGWRYANASNAAEDRGFDNYGAWSAGANFSYAGFTLGGSVLNEYDGFNRGGEFNSTEGLAWDVGGSYGIGPWAVGITYFTGKIDGSIVDSGQDKMQAIQGGVSYNLGPGIQARAGVMWAEWDPEGGFDEQSGVIGAVGLSLSF